MLKIMPVGAIYPVHVNLSQKQRGYIQENKKEISPADTFQEILRKKMQEN